MGIGVPVTIILAVINPNLWPFGVGWIAFVTGLMFYDLLFAPKQSQFEVEQDIPASLYIGSEHDLAFVYKSNSKLKPNNPEMRISVSEKLASKPDISRPVYENGKLIAAFRINALRRGEGFIYRLFLRWTGPLGLVWRQLKSPINKTIAIIPDTRLVKDKAIEIFSRNALHGQKIQIDKGEGTEFDALREFMQGMDKRAIDWKHSARHRKLHAKEFRTERNHNIIFAIDTGYLMSEQLKNMPRIDWAINASLLIAYISLKFGDKVGFFGFDKRPYLFSKPVSGTNSFAHLQKLTSELDYSNNETNFTLGLSQLSKSLGRRSLIIVFTDFIDSINAELMIENISRLIKSHIVIFVVFEDVVLEKMMAKPPKTPKDISRAVLAGNLDKERDIVLARLERMGVQIVRAEIETMSTAVLNRFLELKRKEMI